MREVFIKYNPYRVETVFEIDGKPVKRSSPLNADDRRLQEWIDDLPKNLLEECNTKSFHITFQGTLLDYEDFQSVIAEAKNDGFEIEYDYIPAKEVKDKEAAIDEIFVEIQAGPFEELKQEDVAQAFRNARTSDFPVNVVATMSAGKSTLINALLCQKLMPAKQEACTATITELRDSDNETFHAVAYDKNGDVVMALPELTLSAMETLNANPEVSKIKAEGDIPFVRSEDVALVLVDTPGPNNSRDPEHKAATRRMLRSSSKTLVLYILNATQLAVNDDNDLLNEVADSMKVGGKQSRDRFIFVVNKLDDFKKGEDSVTAAIEKVRLYLKDKGIENPNIYPASALTALDIRTVLKDIRVVGNDDDELERLEEMNPEIPSIISKTRKIVRNLELHLEQYAPLTPSVKAEIAQQLAEAEKLSQSDDKNEKSDGMKQLALIHSGIIPIEAAIRMYVQKYAKTAKIKNIVDTFQKKLETSGSFEKKRQEIALNQDKKAEINAEIQAIRAKMENAEAAKKFQKEIDKISFDGELSDITSDVITKAVERVGEQITGVKGQEWSLSDAERMMGTFERFSENLQAKVKVQLEELLTNHVEKNAAALLEEYHKRLADLTSELSGGGIEIQAFDLIDGDMPELDTAALIDKATETKKVAVGSHYEDNPERQGFFGFFKFWEPRRIKVTDYEKVKYVKAEEIADKFFAPFQASLYKNLEMTKGYAKDQAAAIKLAFKKKFSELDQLLKNKLSALEACANDEKNVDAILREAQERLEWLEYIDKKIKEILDI